VTDASAMEPMLPEMTAELADLVITLVERASEFRGQLNPVLRASVGDLVRSMNCYYSNLIEGHRTTPVDIDRAMVGDYADEPEKRNLQLEARAHIEVQAMIDAGQLPYDVVSVAAIKWMHKEFCDRLPDELLWVDNSMTNGRVAVVPGAFRTSLVKVGRHIPPEPEAIDPLLRRFVDAYTSRMLSRVQSIVSVAASHHRLVWIHPFLDGNGRVTRIFSHAFLRHLGVGSELWSVSRGLARDVERYKALLMAADEPRRGDLDGRGNLTQSGLTDFCVFFLQSCIDQVAFMADLLQPQELLNRMQIWTEEQVRRGRLPRGSWPLLREAVVAGEFPRSSAPLLTGYQERQARTVLSALIERSLLVAPTPRGSVRLGFPVEVLERWLPGLYPVGQ
jgi:Fic family protein